MLFHILKCFLLENDRKIMVPSFWDRTIPIIVNNFPMNKFTLTDTEKTELVNAGSKYVKKFFGK